MNRTQQILKKEMSLSKRAMTGIVIGMALFYVVSFLFCFHVHVKSRRLVRNQAVRSITNISQLNKDSINRAIQNRRLLLEMFSSRMEKSGHYEIDVILDVMRDYQTTYDFYNMGLLDAEGNMYLTDESVSFIPEKSFVDMVWDDSFHLAESRPSKDGKDVMVNAFTCPIYRDGEIVYVMMATYRSGLLTDRMNISSLEGLGDTFLINRSGDIVIYPHNYADKEYSDLMNYINAMPDVIPKDLRDRNFDYNGESYYAHFEELGINDWLLMTCAREREMFADAREISLVIYVAVFILWMAIFFILCMVFYSLRRIRIRRTRELFYDKLLGIPNRHALKVVFERLPRELFQDMYLSVIDVDKFKEFNYIHGNENGDKLLQYIVRTIQELTPDIYLFRYVSDHFVIMDSGKDPQEIGEKLKCLEEKFARDMEAGVVPMFDVSGGVRKLYPEDSLHLAISDAMIAREMVKGNHTRHYAFYDESVREKRLRFMEMESDFSAAVRGKEFHVYYQPQYDMTTGEIIGAEALARWIKPDGTMISPGEFIPCFELSHQVVQLDEVILTEVCSQMKQMEEDGLAVKPVSVNLSRVHLQQPCMFSRIVEIIRQAGISPEKLSFEITESALVEESIPLQTITEQLRSIGCRVDMDDYGVGASGPKALASNCFDLVKLDKSFVDDIGDVQVEAVIEATIRLANTLGLKVLAEGVEELSQANRLVELGCRLSQGFYYSRPVPEAEYRRLLSLSKKED